MYFEQFTTERNIKEDTIRHYKSTITQYETYYGMTIDELINEAIDEENNNVDRRRRSIKMRLLQFRTYLSTERTLRISTVKSHMKKITTFYKHFDIEIPQMPPLKESDRIETTYFDLPTKEQIKMAVNIAGIRIASLILFMASSGTGRTECVNLSIQDFIDATSEYHTKDTLEDIVSELSECEEPIIPTFYLLRQKTNKKYYTFCSPEASQYMIDWLELRLQMAEQNETIINPSDSFWDLTVRQITYHLTNINDELNFGFKGAYRFLRPHTLRKFHASNIGLSQENIDLLQGRSRDSVHETYIKINPSWLKEIYTQVIPNVTIMDTNKKEIIHEEFNININLNFYGENFSTTI